MDNDKKIKMTILLPKLLIQKIRTFVYNTPGMTLQKFFEEGLVERWNRVEEKEQWEYAINQLNAGRPLHIENQ